MRLLLALAALLAALPLAAPAQAAGYAPWCAVSDYGRGNAYWDCQYASIEQCRPHILAGNRGFCNPNPAWAAAEPRKWRYKRYRRYD